MSHDPRFNPLRCVLKVFIASLLALLAACGGGSGGSPTTTPAPPPTTSNPPPPTTDPPPTTTNPPPTTSALAIDPVAVTLDTGSTQKFSANGGQPPYSYSVDSGAGTIDATNGT